MEYDAHNLKIRVYVGTKIEIYTTKAHNTHEIVNAKDVTETIVAELLL